jgi:hypothetical protein
MKCPKSCARPSSQKTRAAGYSETFKLLPLYMTSETQISFKKNPRGSWWRHAARWTHCRQCPTYRAVVTKTVDNRRTDFFQKQKKNLKAISKVLAPEWWHIASFALRTHRAQTQTTLHGDLYTPDITFPHLALFLSSRKRIETSVWAT